LFLYRSERRVAPAIHDLLQGLAFLRLDQSIRVDQFEIKSRRQRGADGALAATGHANQ
jgi:hypothetical protein